MAAQWCLHKLLFDVSFPFIDLTIASAVSSPLFVFSK